MGKTHRTVFYILLAMVLSLVITLLLGLKNIAVLNPKGWVALKERNLIFISTALMLIVVVPVFILMAFVNWKFHAHRKNAKYDPNWDYSFLIETIWWGVPFIIVVALSILAYKTSHELDPFRPIEKHVTTAEPVRIQVVALQWKWLFIYPEEKIASLNFVQFPEKRPLNFEISADAPMNSFWIPELGSQIYAMPAMSTKVHLIASEQGIFRGCSANLSGKGFSGMHFQAKACSEEEFKSWVQSIKQEKRRLNRTEFETLAQPSENNPVTYYVLEESDLYDWVVMKPMMQGEEKK